MQKESQTGQVLGGSGSRSFGKRARRNDHQMSVSSIVIVIHVFEMLRYARMAGSVTLCRSTEGASERQVWAVHTRLWDQPTPLVVAAKQDRAKDREYPTGSSLRIYPVLLLHSLRQPGQIGSVRAGPNDLLPRHPA